MSNVLKELASSEKAVVCIVLLVAASVLAALGTMSIADWKQFALWMAGIYVGGKAIQGGAVALGRGKANTAELADRLERHDQLIDELIEKKW